MGGGIRFALGLHHRHPTDPAFWTPEAATRLAREAEAAGFAAVFFTEHPAPSDDWLSTGGHDALDPFVALAFAAGSTRELRLLTNLTVLAYRNPFLLAKAAATLDRLSGGRLILGAGVGYLTPEYAALGVDFEERNDLFDESLAVCRQVWTGSSVTYEGRHFSARECTALPTPAQDPLPVWIGGNSRLSLRRAAEAAQGWMPLPNPRSLARRRRSPPLEGLGDLARYLDRLHGLRAEAGRSHEAFDVLWVNQTPPPGSPDWDPAAYHADLDGQEALGVTWNAVGCAPATPDDALAYVERFGREVIARR